MSYTTETAILREKVNESIRDLDSGNEAAQIDLKHMIKAWEAEAGGPSLPGKPHPYEVIDGMIQIGPGVERNNLGDHKIRLRRIVPLEN